MSAQSTDVFVVGGGPAGLAVAIASAQRGMTVRVAESALPPIDKACGEGIMPDGVLALRVLGVDLARIAGVPFEGIRFVDGVSEVDARFSQGAGYGVRRVVLHDALVAKAESVHVVLEWGSRVDSIKSGEVVLANGRRLRGKYVVCADGQNSLLRESVGLGAGKLFRRRYGFRSHYLMTPWSQFVEVHWADCGQIYVTPVGAGEVCVVLITRDPHIRLDEVLPHFPELQDRLAGQALSGRSMGGVTATRKLKAVVAGKIALIGDSSGSADAITGDGLSLAFSQATALADAMVAGDLSVYQQQHESIGKLARRMSELLLIMDNYPQLRRKVLAGLSNSPQMFERLVAVHTREISPTQLGLKDCLSLGWKVLQA